MADGDFTLSQVNSDTKPQLIAEAFTLVVGGDYKAGGYAITPANVGLTTILGVCVVDNGAGGGYVFQWKKSTGKLLAYAQTLSATAGLALGEVPDSQAIAMPTIELIVFGYKS